MFVGHPIDLVKVRMQTAAGTGAAVGQAARSVAASTNTFAILRNTFAKEGFRGLYRGVTAPLLAVTPAFAVTFWSYDVSKTVILRNSPGQHELTIQQNIIAGAVSGVPLAAVAGPSERIKCLMQVNPGKYASFSDCLKRVYMEGGLRSVFKGCGATMLRDVPGNAAYFGTYEALKIYFSHLEGTEKASLKATFFAGGFAGIANWLVAIPFDTVKSRYQTAPAGKYTGLPDVVKTLLREEGASAFFRGLSPALIRAFPANAACLAGVETAKSLFANFFQTS